MPSSTITFGTTDAKNSPTRNIGASATAGQPARWRVCSHFCQLLNRNSRDEVSGDAREVLDGCLAHRRADALFHNIVDAPDSFVETNLSQMLAYTIYRGIQAGWLQQSYLAAADEMRAAARRKVDEYGYVQDVCGATNFNKPGRATEGQAFFLRMEAAHRDCPAAS